LVELCHCLLADGRRQEVHFDKITYRIKKLCYGLNMEFVDPVCKLAQLLSVRLFLDITIFLDFQDDNSPLSWILKYWDYWLAGSGAEMHHRAKFCQNWSVHCEDIVIIW